jgi:hypothetical protein
MILISINLARRIGKVRGLALSVKKRCDTEASDAIMAQRSARARPNAWRSSPVARRGHPLAAHSITLVDNLFDALVQEHEDAVEGQRYALIDIPELAQKARAAVDAARQAVQGLDRDGPERSVEEARSR